MQITQNNFIQNTKYNIGVDKQHTSISFCATYDQYNSENINKSINNKKVVNKRNDSKISKNSKNIDILTLTSIISFGTLSIVSLVFFVYKVLKNKCSINDVDAIVKLAKNNSKNINPNIKNKRKNIKKKLIEQNVNNNQKSEFETSNFKPVKKYNIKKLIEQNVNNNQKDEFETINFKPVKKYNNENIIITNYNEQNMSDVLKLIDQIKNKKENYDVNTINIENLFSIHNTIIKNIDYINPSTYEEKYLNEMAVIINDDSYIGSQQHMWIKNDIYKKNFLLASIDFDINDQLKKNGMQLINKDTSIETIFNNIVKIYNIKESTGSKDEHDLILKYLIKCIKQNPNLTQKSIIDFWNKNIDEKLNLSTNLNDNNLLKIKCLNLAEKQILKLCPDLSNNYKDLGNSFSKSYKKTEDISINILKYFNKNKNDAVKCVNVINSLIDSLRIKQNGKRYSFVNEIESLKQVREYILINGLINSINKQIHNINIKTYNRDNARNILRQLNSIRNIDNPNLKNQINLLKENLNLIIEDNDNIRLSEQNKKVYGYKSPYSFETKTNLVNNKLTLETIKFKNKINQLETLLYLENNEKQKEEILDKINNLVKIQLQKKIDLLKDFFKQDFEEFEKDVLKDFIIHITNKEDIYVNEILQEAFSDNSIINKMFLVNKIIKLTEKYNLFKKFNEDIITFDKNNTIVQNPYLGKKTILNLPRKIYEQLFGNFIDNYNIIQYGGTCYITGVVHKILLDPVMRIEYMKKFSVEGNDLIVTLNKKTNKFTKFPIKDGIAICPYQPEKLDPKNEPDFLKFFLCAYGLNYKDKKEKLITPTPPQNMFYNPTWSKDFQEYINGGDNIILIKNLNLKNNKIPCFVENNNNNKENLHLKYVYFYDKKSGKIGLGDPNGYLSNSILEI